MTLTVHSRTEFSAGLYDILYTGVLLPLQTMVLLFLLLLLLLIQIDLIPYIHCIHKIPTGPLHDRDNFRCGKVAIKITNLSICCSLHLKSKVCVTDEILTREAA